MGDSSVSTSACQLLLLTAARRGGAAVADARGGVTFTRAPPSRSARAPLLLPWPSPCSPLVYLAPLSLPAAHSTLHTLAAHNTAQPPAPARL